MRRLFFSLGVAALAACLLLAPGTGTPAHAAAAAPAINGARAPAAAGSTVAAAPAPDTMVEVGPLFSGLRATIEAVAGLAIAAAVGWVALRLNSLAGINIEARHREALQSALLNGVRAGLDLFGKRADAMQVDVRSKVLAEAADYVITSVPDAVKHFGLTPARVRDLARAKLAEAEPPAMFGASGTAPPAAYG